MEGRVRAVREREGRRGERGRRRGGEGMGRGGGRVVPKLKLALPELFYWRQRWSIIGCCCGLV